MDAPNYIVLAIPVFFLLIGVEYVLSLITRRKLYRLNDSVNDLSMGILDQVGNALFGTIAFAGYLYLWAHWKLFDMGAEHVWDFTGIALWVWVACFLCKDFAYYWAHRMSHEMNIGWATHIAHHQSEEFNLSVALRQGAFQTFFFGLFYLPLAFIGFPPVVYLICSQINTLYQFWIHTRLVGKLGPFEWIFNTPSHHRVHHGRDPKYIDRNHAGTLIIWDRIFGTFQEEEEEPNYGLVSPLQSWNPAWGQVHYLVKLGKTAWSAPNWGDKLRIWYKPPAWQPQGMEMTGPTSQDKWERGEFRIYDPETPLGLKLYTLLHFVPILLLATGFLLAGGGEEETAAAADWYAMLLRGSAAGLILWTLVSLGGISELRLWIRWAEPLRLVVMGAALAVFGADLFGFPQLGSPLFYWINLGMGVISLAWVLAYTRHFTGHGALARTELGGEQSAEA